MTEFIVNGKKVICGSDKKLLAFLRDDLGITSVKDGRSGGVCGACTILVDGRPERSCLLKTEKMAGKKEKDRQRIVTGMTWKLKPEVEMDASCGIYFLRTSLEDENRILRDSYNTIRDMEGVFRILKTDLDLRPVFHKKDDATMAHLKTIQNENRCSTQIATLKF